MRRTDFLREIVARPFAKVILAILALLGTAATLRELLLPEGAQQKLNFNRFWSLEWPWWLWVIVVLVAAFAIIFEASFAAIQKREGKLAKIGSERPRVHAVFDWRGSFLEGCYEPILLRNASPIAAQRIRVGDIVGGDSKAATFPLISHLEGLGETKVWPVIDNADTRDGHPDFASFMWAAQIGEAWEVRRKSDTDAMTNTFKAGTTLPFDIAYCDLDGRKWVTRAQVKIGGEWGSGRIVIETVGFE